MTTLPAAATGASGFAVSVADVASTAAAFGRIHVASSGAAGTASGALSGSVGMAGDDGPMALWRARYDAVAGATWAACAAVVGTLHDVAAKLVETGDAYLAADHASTPGTGGAPQKLPPAGPGVAMPAGPPSATGPSGGAAPPNLAEYRAGGDPGRLRSAGAAWTALADGLDDAALAADSAFRTLTAHNTGQGFSAMAAFWASRYVLCGGDPLFNVAPVGARTLGQGCTALAELIEVTRLSVDRAAEEAAAEFAPLTTVAPPELLRLIPHPLPQAVALFEVHGEPLLAHVFVQFARRDYLAQLDELTRQLSPELESRLDRAARSQPAPNEYGTSRADVGEVVGLGLGGSGWDGVPGSTPTPDAINVPPDRAIHILDGDRRGGGHLSGTGRPNKSEFPPAWGRDRIVRTAMSIARDPRVAPVFESGRHYDAWKIEEVRDQILIRVIVKTDGELVTAVPLSGPGVIRNPPN